MISTISLHSYFDNQLIDFSILAQVILEPCSTTFLSFGPTHTVFSAFLLVWFILDLMALWSQSHYIEFDKSVSNSYILFQ